MAVCRSSGSLPTSGSSCLGRALREAGQNRAVLEAPDLAQDVVVGIGLETIGPLPQDHVVSVLLPTHHQPCSPAEEAAGVLADLPEQEAVAILRTSEPSDELGLTTALNDLALGLQKDGAFDEWDPANISPLVAYLSTTDCRFTGETFFAQGGVVKRVKSWEMADTVEQPSKWSVADLAEALAPLAEQP